MQKVYVQGNAVSLSWADDSLSLTDLIFACTTAALDSAGVSIAEVDAVVLSAHDLVDGRGLTNMVTSPSAGAYLKDETRLGDDGAVAFVLGDARVRSGSVNTCLVAAWGRASEGPQDHIAHALFDPFTTRPLALTEVAVSGMRAARALGDFAGYAEYRAAASAKRAPRPEDPARTPATCWPLRAAELPLWADVVAVAVLTSAPGAVAVRGVGMSTEPYELGDRDLTAMTSLRAAAAAALAEADAVPSAMSAAELDGLTLVDEALAAEAVGLAGPGQGMRLLAESDLVNPSGGSSAGWCAPAMGLARICSAADRIGGRPGQLALATGASVVAAQTHTAIVLEGQT